MLLNAFKSLSIFNIFTYFPYANKQANPLEVTAVSWLERLNNVLNWPKSYLIFYELPLQSDYVRFWFT